MSVVSVKVLVSVGVSAVATIAAGWAWINSDQVPMTREQHNKDIANLIDSFETGIDKVIERVDKNQMEWRCDEVTEELDNLLMSYATDPRPTEAEDIRNLRVYIDENSCADF